MEKSRILNVRDVSGWELNLMVAIAKGIEIVGRALCYADPESGWSRTASETSKDPCPQGTWIFFF